MKAIVRASYIETLRSTPRVIANGDVVEGSADVVRIDERVQEAKRRKSLSETSVVEQGDYSGERRRSCSCATDGDCTPRKEYLELVCLSGDVRNALNQALACPASASCRLRPYSAARVE